MRAILDLTGHTFTRLTVIRRAPNSPKGRTRWHCKCICGRNSIVYATSLQQKTTKSCGCLHREKTIATNTTHQMRHIAEYRIFIDIKTRCHNPRNKSYPRYGGRGITVEWETFEAFYADLGPRPSPEFTIERVDNDGPYSKSNCIWATQKTQQNNRCNNHHIDYEGRIYTQAQLAEH